MKARILKDTTGSDGMGMVTFLVASALVSIGLAGVFHHLSRVQNESSIYVLGQNLEEARATFNNALSNEQACSSAFASTLPNLLPRGQAPLNTVFRLDGQELGPGVLLGRWLIDTMTMELLAAPDRAILNIGLIVAPGSVTSRRAGLALELRVPQDGQARRCQLASVVQGSGGSNCSEETANGATCGGDWATERRTFCQGAMGNAACDPAQGFLFGFDIPAATPRNVNNDILYLFREKAGLAHLTQGPLCDTNEAIVCLDLSGATAAAICGIVFTGGGGGNPLCQFPPPGCGSCYYNTWFSRGNCSGGTIYDWRLNSGGTLACCTANPLCPAPNLRCSRTMQENRAGCAFRIWQCL